MDGARGAKDINRFYVNCLGRMLKYNITIIAINHIRPKVVADKFSQPPAGLMMLRNGEMLVRGYAPQYYSQNFFRIDSLKSNMYSMDDVGFEGFKSSIQIAKTKTAFIGATVDACFNSAIGFDPVYSLLEYAYSIGIVQGKNPWLYLLGADTYKFSRRDFRNKFLGEKIFRTGFLDTLMPHLEKLLGSKTVTDEDRVKYGDLMREQELRMQSDDVEGEKELQKEAVEKSKTKKVA
jgi:hypothetical protein